MTAYSCGKCMVSRVAFVLAIRGVGVLVFKFSEIDAINISEAVKVEPTLRFIVWGSEEGVRSVQISVAQKSASSYYFDGAKRFLELT